ncbi:GNAT family protein [Emcibacter sp.]|uniref:GNAT family N-acetyltransferase n=1 Tax=Emcibacter sp. TaxID=1979954 RepID=UPI002AA92239|nr:GNAT family protein [Emcibacter sp.]
MTDENRKLGEPVENWSPPPAPSSNLKLEGEYVSLQPLSAEIHAEQLFQANSLDREGGIWDYLAYGPFASLDDYLKWVKSMEGKSDPFCLAIQRKDSGEFCGVASFMRITPRAGSLEVGHLCFSPKLQKTVAATEAMFLMMKWAFEAGYRRYEWKCNSLNLASRRAAQRLGFSYEGIFRQALVSKGRNRDTAWFAVIDKEWPELENAFQAYLAPENFDQDGRQICSLALLTRKLLYKTDFALTAPE